MATYGPSIYGTRAGPVPPRSWGATTQRGDSIFVHVLDWMDPTLSLPPIAGTISSASVFLSGAPVNLVQSATGVTLTLPADTAVV